MDGEVMNKVLNCSPSVKSDHLAIKVIANFAELKILKKYLCICNSKNNPELLKIRECFKRQQATSHKLYSFLKYMVKNIKVT